MMFTVHYWDGQIKNNNLGAAYSTRGRFEEFVHNFGRKIRREGNNLKNLRHIIVKQVLKNVFDSTNSVYLAQDGDLWWRTVINTVMNFIMT